MPPSMLKKGGMAFVAFLILVAGAWVFMHKPRLPVVTFHTLEGQELLSSSLKGNVLLVNFWATTCSACIKEMPMLVRTYERHKARGFELIAVAMDYDPPDYVKRYARGYNNGSGLPFVVALDKTGDVARAFEGVRLTPTTFLLDRQGRIIQQYLGEPDEKQLNARIEQLLGS
jgi:thiol-disulfide isomerase/thioredoxin